MKPRTYATPVAFKRALEDRLKGRSASGVDFGRRRQLLVFDRFLARIAATFGDTAVLKGGLVLELRLERARTTKDIDLRLPAPGGDVHAKLQAAGQLALGDFMSFEVRPSRNHPEITGDGVQYDGYRYQAECQLASKIYGLPFGVDVAFDGGEPPLVVLKKEAESAWRFGAVSSPAGSGTRPARPRRRRRSAGCG